MGNFENGSVRYADTKKMNVSALTAEAVNVYLFLQDFQDRLHGFLTARYGEQDGDGEYQANYAGHLTDIFNLLEDEIGGTVAQNLADLENVCRKDIEI